MAPPDTIIPPGGPPNPAPGRLTVEQYHRLGEAGVLTPDDRVELLEGFVVLKPRKTPAHVTACSLTRRRLEQLVPPGWHVSSYDPITLGDSEPEPDLTVVRGRFEDYAARHPVPADVALVVEGADSSLLRDREWKKRVYARNGIPAYWIVNLVDRVLEVYTDPSGPVLTPDYGTARVLSPAADRADVSVGGAVVGAVAVADLFP